MTEHRNAYPVRVDGAADPDPVSPLAVAGQVAAAGPALRGAALPVDRLLRGRRSSRSSPSCSPAATRAPCSTSTSACCAGPGGCTTTATAPWPPTATRRSRWPRSPTTRRTSTSPTPSGCPAGWSWSSGGCSPSRSTSSSAIFVGGGLWVGIHGPHSDDELDRRRPGRPARARSPASCCCSPAATPPALRLRPRHGPLGAPGRRLRRADDRPLSAVPPRPGRHRPRLPARRPPSRRRRPERRSQDHRLTFRRLVSPWPSR